MGDGTWVVPYNIGNNIPADCLATRHGTYWISRESLIEAEYNLCNAHIDHIQTGLAGHKAPCETGFMLSDEIGFYINSGKIIVKGHLQHFKGDCAIFRDQSMVGPIDHILFATGFRYHTEIPFLEKGIRGGICQPYTLFCFDTVKENVTVTQKKKIFFCREKGRLYKHIFQVDLEHQTLAFIGYFAHLGPAFALFELQARWACGVLVGIYHLPERDIMKKEVALVGPETTQQLSRDLVRLIVEYPYII